ncbi:hypothetical protein LRP50_18370 [Enterovibrio sp. ZSDZ42]|uniref:Uncharacterized protein n=1 Tax=Enterovibrio gelatinilyticus TaxID=2899819 RepID=A0ABT5R491_9GAMM|nr:hypothetical protein [Enterovibrio sp. ZSDZ42]MDD1795097.1 hypothetical protein [Enterovibrio sp. ZSDZ42]
MKHLTKIYARPIKRPLNLNVTLFITLIAWATAWPALAANTSKAANIDYGYSKLYGELTPTQVYSLVKNIDSMVMHYAYRYQPKLTSKLPRKIVPVNGYRPEQVFVALGKLSDDIDVFAKQQNVEPVKRIKREAKEAIPAEVFLLAGASLDTFSEALAVLEPTNTFGDFYSQRTYSRDKTPSDVYALVDLINRKLTILLGQPLELSE